MSNQPPSTKPSRRWWHVRPLLRSLGGRVRFVVLFTAVLVGAASLWLLGQQQLLGQEAALRALDQAHRGHDDITELLDGIGAGLLALPPTSPSRLDELDCSELSARLRPPVGAVFGVAGPDGRIVCSTAPMASSSGVEWLRRASPPPTLGVAAVVDGQGESSVVVALAGDGSTQDTVYPFVLLPSAILADRLGSADGYRSGLLDARGRLVAGRGAEGQPSAQLVTEILARKRGVVILTEQGVRRAYAFKSAVPQNLGRLYQFYGADLDSLMPGIGLPSWQAGLTLALCYCLLVACALLVGHLVVTMRIRRFARRLRKLLGSEAEGIRLPGGLGELDGIVGGFRSLSKRLAALQSSIDERVRARTSTLTLSKGITELQKARTDALLASIAEGVIATDTQGRISFLNETARAALWLKGGRTEGMPVNQAFRLENAQGHPVQPDEWPIWPAINKGETVITPAPTKPLRFVRGDGGRFPVKMIVSPVAIDNEAVGALIVFDDITAAVEFDERKSEFISVASHQLRSPSAAVKFIADMMRKGDFGELTPKQAEWMEKLYAASDALLNMVTELLNISRIEAGVQLDPQEQDLASFMKETLGLVQPLLAERRQQLELAYDEARLPRMVFDRFSVGETIRNLLSNASKYSPEESTVTFKIEASAEVAFFSVRDRGMGVPKSSRGQMFSKFFRAENATGGAVTGTGLGLYYCKQVIERHGGSIGFESEEGRGSIFWFTLPVDGAAIRVANRKT
jgi:signal transduction histidine kinase